MANTEKFESDQGVRMIPEECQELNGAVLLIKENCFSLYHSKYNLSGTGFTIEEALQDLERKFKSKG
jgi:hypothetical protein